MKRLNLALAAGMVLGLIALAFHPATRKLVRQQLALACGIPNAAARQAQALLSSESKRTVTARPTDSLPLQMAVAGVGEAAVPKLRALREHFPNEPALYALILRRETQRQVSVNRPKEEAALSRDPKEKPKAPKVLDSEVLAAFDADAATGEKIDPDNAYFPLLRAIVHLARQEDAAALAALHRAASKPRYDDYVRVEADGLGQWADRMYGETTGITKAALAASVLYPHFASVRSVARVAVVLAIQKEKRGDIEGGVAIRRDLRLIGGRMRHDATTLIGNLVGNAIAAIGTTLPAGQRDPAIAKINNGDKRAAAQLQFYLTYLRHHGLNDEAQAAERERAAGNAVRENTNRALEDVRSPMSTARIGTVVLLRFLAQGSLAILLALLIQAALLTGLERTERIQAELPAHPGVKAGLWILLVAGPLGGIGFATLGSVAWLSVILLFFAAGVSITTLTLNMVGRAEPSKGISVLGAAVATVIVGGLCCSLPAVGLVQTGQEFSSLVAIAGMMNPDASVSLPLSVFLVAGTVVLLFVSLLLAGGVVLESVRRGLPATVGLVRFYPCVALCCGFVLLFCYGVQVRKAVQEEVAYESALQIMSQHEGRFYARLVGKPWPE